MGDVMRRRAIRVSDVMFDQKAGKYYGQVLVADAFGVSSQTVYAPGHPSWDLPHISKALGQRALSKGVRCRS